MSSAEQLRRHAARLRATAPTLRRAGAAELDGLVACCRDLARDEDLIRRVAESSRLSLEGVRWGLATTFESLDGTLLERLRERVSGETPAELAAVVLAGNVFTAGARALLVPLVLGVPTLVKASSRDSAFIEALVDALPAPFAASAHVTVFAGGDAPRERALLADADVIHVYGSDASVRALRGRAPAHGRFVAHGHGVGVAYVDGFGPEHARGLALDVAAYDQRGCLSPVEVMVRGDGAKTLRFAEALSDALEDVERELPRGVVDAARRALLAQWRGVALATGTLFEGSAHAVSVLPEGVELSAPAGTRSVVLRSTPDAEVARRRWSKLGGALKCLGTSTDLAATPVPPGTRPRICRLGEMQRPPFDADADGCPVTEGYSVSPPTV